MGPALTTAPVVIERSRIKTVLVGLGCVAFIVASLAILTLGTAGSLVVGVLGLVTFGGFLVAWVVMLFRRGPGLVIDDEGFTDSSSGVSVGRVLWSDVTGISTWSFSGSPSVIVGVRNPEDYLARLGWFRRRLARINLGMVGSPVTLASTGLRTNFDGLLAALTEAYERYRARQL